MDVKEIDGRFLIRLQPGEEVMTALRAWADEHQVGFAMLSAIGALRRATLGYFDPVTKAYRHLPVEEQVEVVSLSGNVSRGEDGSPVIHAHAVLGRSDGSTLGGHLAEGIVSPTLEVVLFVLPGTAQRRRDPATGLALWDLT
ncbi:MAG TPA: DUF296 domain-containing protein [Anaerolineales bacterium]|nr:DUF296 domain-containing protein [Anaerolineae bacterium]HIQ02624.1 DUF296 domain-containing protein [Anaerolineales bacterium]